MAWLVGFVGPKIWNGSVTAVRGPPKLLSVAVVTDLDRFTSSADADRPINYLIARPLAEIGKPPNSDDSGDPDKRWAWAHALGGVDEFSSLVRVQISGRDAGPVIIDNLRVEVTRRRGPLRAWDVGYSGEGSAQGTRVFEFDLDNPSPKPAYQADTDGKPDPDPLPLRVTRTDVEILDLVAMTGGCDCQWQAKLDWTAEDRKGTTVINNHGKPFETAAPVLTASGDLDPNRHIFWQNGRWERFVGNKLVAPHD